MGTTRPGEQAKMLSLLQHHPSGSRDPAEPQTPACCRWLLNQGWFRKHQGEAAAVRDRGSNERLITHQRPGWGRRMGSRSPRAGPGLAVPLPAQPCQQQGPAPRAPSAPLVAAGLWGPRGLGEEATQPEHRGETAEE